VYQILGFNLQCNLSVSPSTTHTTQTHTPFHLIRSKLQYASAVCNSIASTNAKAGTHPTEVCTLLFYTFLSPCPLRLCLCFRIVKTAHGTSDEKLFIIHVYPGSIRVRCPSLFGNCWSSSSSQVHHRLFYVQCLLFK
jgi:hypothetical protein